MQRFALVYIRVPRSRVVLAGRGAPSTPPPTHNLVWAEGWLGNGGGGGWISCSLPPPPPTTLPFFVVRNCLASKLLAYNPLSLPIPLSLIFMSRSSLTSSVYFRFLKSPSLLGCSFPHFQFLLAFSQFIQSLDLIQGIFFTCVYIFMMVWLVPDITSPMWSSLKPVSPGSAPGHSPDSSGFLVSRTNSF